MMNVLNRRTCVTVAALALFLVAGGSTGVASITKAPKKPSASVGNATVTEGNTGTATLSFRVRLSARARQGGSVKFTTADGTATAGSDYQTASGTIRFKSGDRSKTISITVLGDTFVEPDETLTLRLSKPVKVKIARATATGTITNDDVQPKSGHYAGQTSQGKPVSFDVAADVKSLNHFNATVDLTCSEVPIVLRNFPFDLQDAPIDLTSTWTFGFSIPVSESDVSGNIALSGALSTTGPATGSIKIDLAIPVSGGTVHCSTGTVTWSATAAS
jgi:hypothetical protein